MTILAVDQGTTSSRAIIFSEDGKILAVAQKELTQHYPKNGWVEHNPMDIWQDTKDCVDELLAKHKDVKAIGITNQRETTILWNKETGEPIYNAIVWQDRRTAEYCQQLKDQGRETEITQKTGLLLDAYFSATKIKWILDHVEGARALADAKKLAFGTVETWLLWKLTDGQSHSTDVTNASRTMLYNIHTGEWDQELLNIFDIPENILPGVHPNVYEFGNFKGIPITGMAGDQQAATIGQACFEEGMVKCTYGTGCFVLFNTGKEAKASKNKLLATIAYDLGEGVHYAIEGSIFNAGTAIQWLRDELGIISDAGETETLATSVPDNGGVYFIPAFTGLGAPYWNPNARGMITGITRDTGKAHIIRAALEAQAYQTKDLVTAMEEDAGTKISTLRVDGGMVKNNFVCQFLSDTLQIPVERPEIVETTALGAAYCAGLGAGVYSSKDVISERWSIEKKFEASKADSDSYSEWKSLIGNI